jgi:acetylglutamate kinase
MAKISKPEYEEKVRTLSEEEAERLLSRMSGKLPKRLQKEKLTREEALAIQLEVEDEQLEEWRKNMKDLNNNIDETGKFKTIKSKK